MFTKKAVFNLIDMQPLNNPSFDDTFIKKQDLNIKVSSLYSDAIIDGNSNQFDLQAEIEQYPNSLYVECFAIKADETNDNGDHFTKNELRKATDTFVGVPVFTNHQNTDVEKARGTVVHSWWDDSKNGIMIVARVDAEAYPQLARGIKQKYVAGTSMGASRGHDLVSMADGSKTRVDELQISQEVFTHSGKIEKVKAICRTQEHSQLYHIRWSGNTEGLALSYEHPVLVLKREDVYKQIPSGKTNRKNIGLINKEVQPEFIPASEVKSGDYVLELIDSTEAKAEDNITESIAFLLGAYAAQGYINTKDGCVTFDFGLNDKNAEKTKELLQSYTDDFSKLCHSYIGADSHNKKLHTNIKRWPKLLQKRFLEAYIDGDGCKILSRLDKNGYSSEQEELQVSSASLQLLKDIRCLLLRLGIPSTLKSHERVAKKSTAMKPDTKYVEHILCMSSTVRDELDKYNHKAYDNTKTQKSKLDSFFYKNYVAHRIKDVAIINNNEPTYYVQIGEIDDPNSDHSYILNDIATHNCSVQYSLCSVCHNYAESPDQYCTCIRERKTRHVESSKQECNYHKHGTDDHCPICKCEKGKKNTFAVDTKAFEYNYGIKFIENSFVVNPACHDCGVTEVIDPQKFRKKVASIKAKLPSLLKSADKYFTQCEDGTCYKTSGQKEIQDLNQALELISSVSKSMLDQRQQIDLEFLSDMTQVLADLQGVSDELIQQGYGSLPSPGEDQTQDPNIPQDPTIDNMSPTNPLANTPGGGSKIQSGDAGEAGTVTTPMAHNFKLNLEKVGSKTQNKTLKPKLQVTKMEEKPKRKIDISFKMS